MARALIVGCGCRGRQLGRRLRAAGWRVRGTTRDPANREEILAAGVEPVVVDPDRAATVLDHVGDVTLVFWLLGSARGRPEALAALHGPRLERLLERLVDTPVRGFVYESVGTVEPGDLERGTEIVERAAARWRIPVALVAEEPQDGEAWTEAMLEATGRLVGR